MHRSNRSPWWLALPSLVLACLVLPALAVPASAQEAEAPPEPEAEQPVEDFSRPMGPADPFNRGAPQGSMYGYITASRDGDYEKAANFLDLRRLPPGQGDRGPELARKLKSILDQKLWIDLAELADTNDGTPDDGLPLWQDRLGQIKLDDDRRFDGTIPEGLTWEQASAYLLGVDVSKLIRTHHADLMGPVEAFLMRARDEVTLARLVRLSGMVGRDPTGDMLEALLAFELGLATTSTPRPPRPSG